VIVYSPMASGLLTGAMTAERIAALPADDWRKGNSDFQEPQFSRNLRLVRLLRAIGNRHGRTPGEVAVAWVLHNPAVTGAIVGARRSEQVRGVVGAVDFRLSVRELAEIEAFWAEQPHSSRAANATDRFAADGDLQPIQENQHVSTN
jgi:aryl-alcohol dehydrogenase-like predicted oxidoreductase